MPDASDEFEILSTDEQLAGLYANWTRVTLTSHEFTVDFARIDPTASLPMAILVARIALSSQAFEGLLTRMEAAWTENLRRSLPPEVGDDG